MKERKVHYRTVDGSACWRKNSETTAIRDRVTCKNCLWWLAYMDGLGHCP